jgi:hypothetical protein
LNPKPGSQVQLLGFNMPLAWRTESSGAISVDLPESIRKSPPSQHAIAIKFERDENH